MPLRPRGLLTNFLARTSNRNVVLVQHNAHLVHEPYLLLVVACHVIVLGGGVVCTTNERSVDFGEEAQDIRRRNSGSLRNGSSGAHDCDSEQKRFGYCRVASVLVVEVNGN